MAITPDGAVDVIAGLHIWTEAGGAGDWLALAFIGASTAAIVVLHVAVQRMFRPERDSRGEEDLRRLRGRRGRLG